MLSAAPTCAAPGCHRPCRTTKRGGYSKYCDDPNCRKKNWYHAHLSASCRATTSDKMDQVLSDLAYIKGTIDPRQQPLPRGAAQLPLPFEPAPPAEFDYAEPLEITTATADPGENPTWNFMISSALSVYGHCDYLPA